MHVANLPPNRWVKRVLLWNRTGARKRKCPRHDWASKLVAYTRFPQSGHSQISVLRKIAVFFPALVAFHHRRSLWFLNCFAGHVSRHVGETGCLFLSRWLRPCQRAGPVQARAHQRVAGRRLGSGGWPEARPGVSSGGGHALQH